MFVLVQAVQLPFVEESLASSDKTPTAAVGHRSSPILIQQSRSAVVLCRQLARFVPPCMRPQIATRSRYGSQC
jgi:hypothetical protein